MEKIDDSWKKDYSIYKDLELKAYNDLVNDKDFLNKMQEMLPVVDILATMEKSHREYWSQDCFGWNNKKSKRAKSVNWKLTYMNACKMEWNQIKRGNQHPMYRKFQ